MGVLPFRVPLKYFTKDQAKGLGYTERQDVNYAVSKLHNNQQMYIFSTANIRREKDRRFLALRLEGFVLRIRYVVYQMILVSLSTTPSLVSLAILLTESLHVSVYFYYAVRYRYAKNWILIVSKFNVGFTIIYFSLLSLVLSLRQDNSTEMSFVSKTLQGFGMTVAVNCFLLESILLVLNLSTSIYEMYLDWKNEKP